jgi:hypothetical protein
MADNDIMEKLNKFYAGHKNQCLALKSWIERQMKSFSLIDALTCIYEFTDGKTTEMSKVISQITEKRKVRGRSQVYSDEKIPFVDIEKGEDGKLTVTGYNPDKEPQAKGMKVERNPKIFNKGDDNQTNKNYRRIEHNVHEMGEAVRTLYPNFSTDEITMAIDAIRRYSAEKKLGYGRIIMRLKKGKLVLDGDYNISEPSVKESRIIVISEETMREINDKYRMTEEKFFNGVKKFLSCLLSDPVNADTSERFKAHDLDRNKLIGILKEKGILSKRQRINDKDENGDFKPATMRVKYMVAKKDFERKLKRLYIELFEKNKSINEEEGGSVGTTNSDSSGQFLTNAFPIIRRKIDETDTNSAGDYQFTVPFPGDEETLARKNGVGGSVSINFED